MSLKKMRPIVLAISVLTIGSLVAAACGDDKTTTDTGSGGSTTTPAPAGAGTDFSKLSGTINGSGATFPKSFYEEAISGFSEVAKDVTVNYGGGGSGKGKTDLQDQVVDWAGTDSLVKDEDKAKFKGGEFLYFPTVAAPITVSYHLEGVDKLQLSGPTLAKIYTGAITVWNDPAIAADNAGVTLPGDTIVPVHRSDGSGTTSNFSKYLKAAGGADWTLEAGDTVSWPGGQAGNGNAGVAQLVKDTNFSIGYVDLSDAKATGLTFASIKNKAGQYIQPTLEGATAALEGAKVADNLTYSALDTAGEKAYPITAGTYILVYAKQTDATKGAAVKGWIDYVLTDGQTTAPTVDFAPLPSALQTKAVAQLDKITVG